MSFPNRSRRENMDRASLLRALDAFVNAGSRVESRRVVEAHPELLTDEARFLLDDLIVAHKIQGNDRVALVLRDRRRLLDRCRREGVDAVFGDQGATESLATENSAIAELLAQLFLVRSERELQELLAGHPELMTLIEQITPQTVGPQQIEVMLSLPLFIRASSWTESKRVVEAHPELLTDQADSYLAKLVTDAEDRITRRTLQQHRRLLARCRTEGIDSAFRRLVLGIEDELVKASKEVQQIERQLSQPASDPQQWSTYVRLAERGLALVESEDFPSLWIAFQGSLAHALAQTPDGNQEENREQAIAAFVSVLEVATQTEFPVQWANTKRSLGDLFRERTRGNRAENLEYAITAYNAALEVFTMDDFPEQWARTQISLGAAYADRIRGNRAENLDQAMGAYSVSLTVYTLEDFPLEWARVQHGLGRALTERVRGDQAGNLERAIIALKGAVVAFELAKQDLDWAAAQISLGNALRKCVWDDHADNLEQSLSAYTSALTVFTQDDFPVQWAGVQNNLGAAYAERIRGDRAENQERAIAAFTAALEVVTRADFPAEWATTQNNLGNAYAQRIRGDRAENLERAITTHSAVLEVVTRADFPELWADSQAGLGATYIERMRGDRANNLERAIAACAAALEVLTKDDFPVKWASVQDNLGNAYDERIRGDRTENIERAIAAYTAALEVRTQADLPVDWATTQMNLGLAYTHRIRGDRAENVERAIVALEGALKVRTRTDYPFDWARTRVNLGAIYLWRIRGDRAENLEQAIAACTMALEVLTKDDFPEHWIRAQLNLGAALSERLQGERIHNLEEVFAALQAAMDTAQTMGIREYERRAAYGLGSLYSKEGQWALAYKALNTAISALEAMRTAYFSEEAKGRLAEENAQLYARMADTCLHLGHPQEALERVEAGKGRLFLDQLGYDAFPVPALPAKQQPLLERETRLVNELRSLEHAIRNAPGEDRWRQFVAQQEEIRAALDEVWAQVEPHAPDYVALRRGDPVKFDDLQALVDGFGTAAALVEFYTLPDKIIVFVLQSGEKEPEVAQVSMPQEQLLRHVENYWREVVEYRQRGDVGQRWQELAGPLLADVLLHLSGAELVYLVPHGLLHYLPLHALRVNGQYLIDRFPIAYAPSAAVLGRVIQRRAGEPEKHGQSTLVVGDPNGWPPLQYAVREAQQVAALFDTQPYLRYHPTKALVQHEMPGKAVIHMACHGQFDPSRPLQSHLCLAFHSQYVPEEEQKLTAREIMGLQLHADLVTLSACQTGLTEPGLADDPTGLPRAFLYAGASSLVVSLWSVDDKATGDLMVGFYQRLYGDEDAPISKAVALQQAMLELRKKKEHPYYWAPFILVGDWR